MVTVTKVRGLGRKVLLVLKVLPVLPAWPLVIRVYVLRSKVLQVLRVLPDSSEVTAIRVLARPPKVLLDLRVRLVSPV